MVNNMEKNKTAMQEMLEWTRRTFPMDLDTPMMIEDKIESLIEKEKEQIKHAIMVGISIGFDDNPEYVSEKFYNITYANAE